MSKTTDALQQIDDTIAQGPFAASWPSLQGYQVPAWYEDGKFGIFIHWGAYAVPAFNNEWYARNMYLQGSPEYQHHVQTYGPHTEFGYKDFIPQLTAERFDAAAWAALFKEAGARFVVPVAEHHDGFPMYDCAFSEWNAVNMGPKRDIIGDLAAAVREQDMVFGVSSHRAEHWWFFHGGMKFDSDVQDPANLGLYGPAQLEPEDRHNPKLAPPDREFLDDWLVRTCELVDKYQPQLLWFDWWIVQEAFAPYLRKFAAYYYNQQERWGKGVAINHKYESFPEGTAVFDVERGQLDDIRPLFWQADTSVSKNSWGYISHHDYKEAGSIIHDLADVVSKNGALLLNIGPKPDGSIPEPEVAMLQEIGRWLDCNGEAIYGTRPWKVFGEGPTAVTEGAFTDTRRAAFTSADVRFTTKGDALYAIVLGWPDTGEVTVRSLGTHLRLYTEDIGTLTLLGSDTPGVWSRHADGLHVTVPVARPCDHAFVLKIEP